ncbi:MAG: alpha-2-macroglobulin [Bacteroidota bacterium]|nr:alpha-2-macroglobulin [Bacteroidota bacterium]
MNFCKHLCIILSFAVFSSCSVFDSESLKISSLPHGIVPANNVFEFNFSRRIVSADSVGVWTTTPYVEFSPTIEGKFIWQDSTRLVFTPDAPLPGDQRFKGELNVSLLKNISGASTFSGDDEFEFSTEQFFMKSAEFFYDRIGAQRVVGVKANLEFTYAVNPDDVRKYLKIDIDGVQHSDVRVMTTTVGKIIPIELGSMTQLEKPRTINVSFNNELKSSETNTTITMNVPFVYKLPGLEELKIYGHEFGFDGSDSWITIKTSQEIDLRNVKQFITLEPSRTFNIEKSEGRGFTLRGKFEPGSTFQLKVKKGIESVLGAKSQNDYDADIVIGNIQPSIRFASAGMYMLLGGAKSVDIRTINTPKLKVSVSQIFQNNLTFFLASGRSYDYDYSEDEDGEGSYHRYYRFYVSNFGKQLETKELDIPSTKNKEISTQIDLVPYLNNGRKGFYLVEVFNPEQTWKRTSKLISISDIGLIVKRSEQVLHVFAVSLETNKPLGNVTIDLISYNNQSMASAQTNGDGMVEFKNFAELSKEFTLNIVTARKGEDFNFIALNDYRVETSRFDVAGKYDTKGMYDAFMYGDRNLYRPGEKIFVSGIIRNLNNDLPANLPVRIKIYNPRGAMLTELKQNLNEEGSFEISYTTPMTSQTGTYRFDLQTGDESFLASHNVSVEDFVPDRLRVNLATSKESLKPGDKISYDLQAFNFFGPPASNRHWEFEGTFTIVPYQSKQFSDFRFYDDNATNYSSEPLVKEGETDEEGKAQFDFTVPRDVTSQGLLRARARVAVFDESGRPVYQLAQTTVYPKEYYIGVKNSAGYYVNPNTPQKVQIVAVDAGDVPIKGFTAHMEVIREEWHSVLRVRADGGGLRYISEKREVLVSAQDIVLDGKPRDVSYSVPHSGEYVVRISKAGESGYNQFGFYSYSWATTDITSFQIDPEARVDIVLDKKVYAPGENAKALFMTPFDGTLLVTVERNKVFTYQYLETKNNTASMDIDIEDAYLPNAYVSAVLFRKVKGLNIPLLAGHGFEPLMVERASNRFTVSIEAPEKIRPKRKLTITVNVGDEKNVFVTLAAVDEGICQVKNYQTPNPYSYFYAKKALEVETFDFFKDLINEPEQRGSSTGGGDDAMIAKRANPLGVQRFKPVSLWSGILKTNSDGKAEVTLDIPEFNGELRLMALAYKGDRFGSTQKAMKVADPVVLSPSLPRFVSPGDIITMPINAFNTTDKPVSLKFEIVTDGPIKAEQKSVSLELSANQEKFVNVPLKATEQIGKATITVRTSAFGETIESVTELPVRPISPYVTESVSGFVEGGKTFTHDMQNVFLEYGRQSYVTLSPFPVANFAKELKYLIGYPHGCLEQTTSKAFPQIYLRDIALLLDPSILSKGSPTYFVNEAITKISTMQRDDGSFDYWPGGGYYNGWTSVYATHFLVEAKKAGYQVPEATLKGALNSLYGIARSKGIYDYYYYENNATKIKRIADKSAIYALYILALAGQPEKSVMSFYRTNVDLLTNDTRYLLGGAYALSGDRKASLEIMPPQFITEEVQRTSGQFFDSPIRSTAIIANILLETDPNNVNVARYLEHLSGQYQHSYWFSTQDNAFTLLAFGKAARLAGAGGKIEATLSAEGKKINYTGGNKRYDLVSANGQISLSVKGEGRLYYSIVTEGIRSDGKVRIEDKNLRVRREFFDRNGSGINLDAVKQNSLIVVKLTLQSEINELDNVAISDLLPAGFEIENPRLTETTEYNFIRNASTPEYVDIRDDRINYYTNFNGSRVKTFYYMVRAVSKGEFQYAPIVAEAMYDGNYYSANGRRTLKVVD